MRPGEVQKLHQGHTVCAASRVTVLWLGSNFLGMAPGTPGALKSGLCASASLEMNYGPHRHHSPCRDPCEPDLLSLLLTPSLSPAGHPRLSLLGGLRVRVCCLTKWEWLFSKVTRNTCFIRIRFTSLQQPERTHQKSQGVGPVTRRAKGWVLSAGGSWEGLITGFGPCWLILGRNVADLANANALL